MAVSHHPQFPGLSISICLKIWCSTHPPALRQKCVRVGQIKRFSSLPADIQIIQRPAIFAPYLPYLTLKKFFYDSFQHTVGGRNPAPSWMVETL